MKEIISEALTAWQNYVPVPQIENKERVVLEQLVKETEEDTANTTKLAQYVIDNNIPLEDIGIPVRRLCTII